MQGSPPMKRPAAMALASSSVAHVSVRSARSFSGSASTLFWWVSGTLRIQPSGSVGRPPRASRKISLYASRMREAGTDSGIGGISYTKATLERMPHAESPRQRADPSPGHYLAPVRGGSRAENRGAEDPLRARPRAEPEPFGVRSERQGARAGEGGTHGRRAGARAQGGSATVHAEDPGVPEVTDDGGGDHREEVGRGLPGQGRGRKGRDENAVGDRDHDDQAGHRRLAPGHRQGEGALSGHADRRHRLRLFDPARRAHHLRAQSGDPLLDRGRADDEDRRQEQARLPGEPRLRRSRRATPHQAGRDAGVRGGADRRRQVALRGMRPATARTLRGAASQIKAAEAKLQPIAIQNATT